MLHDQTSPRMKKAFEAMAPVYEFFGKYQAWTAEKSDDACDFAVGNPHEVPLPDFVKALEKALTPQDNELLSLFVYGLHIRQDASDARAKIGVYCSITGDGGAGLVTISSLPTCWLRRWFIACLEKWLRCRAIFASHSRPMTR
jgi:hypothetical protein